MKKIILSCIFVISAISPVFADGKLKAVITQAKASVVYVYEVDADGRESGQGTGFFVNQAGYIVTNRHVVEDAEKVRVKTPDGKKYELSKVINSDEDSDLFVFTVEGLGRRTDYLSPGSKLTEVGDDVMVVGNPLGLEQTVSTGIVSAVRDMKESGTLYQITAPISPGSSGSPVLDYGGNVIGVAVMQAREGQNLNFVVPGSKIKALLVKPANMTFAQWKEKGYTFEPETVFGMLNFGYRLYWDEKYDEAVKYSEKIIKIKPGYSKAYVLRGQCMQGKGDNDSALKDLKHAIALEPGLENVHNILGKLYGKMGQNDLAAAEYYAEIKEHPENVNPYFNLAIMYDEIGRREDAAKITAKGLAAAGNTSLLHVLLAMQFIRTGDYAKCISEYKTAIETDPDCIEAYFGLAQEYMKNFDYSGALDVHMALKKRDRVQAEKLYKVINQK